jgi:hypothetical protein
MTIKVGQNCKKALAAKSSQEDEVGNRAVWERPAVRQLATEYAQGGGPLRSEGMCTGSGAHSAKQAAPC